MEQASDKTESLDSFLKTVKNLLFQTPLALLSVSQAVNIIVTLYSLALFIVTWWYIQRHHAILA